MTELAPIRFLLDLDNTLLDNDRIIDDLKAFLTQAFGTNADSDTRRSLRIGARKSATRIPPLPTLGVQSDW